MDFWVSGLTLSVHGAIAEIPAAEWDALLAHEPDRASPFVRHAFLAAAEESRCATPASGWRPRHLALRRGRTLVAAAPAFRNIARTVSPCPSALRRWLTSSCSLE